MKFEREVTAMNEDMAETQLKHTIRAEYEAKHGSTPPFLNIELLAVVAKLKTTRNHKPMKKYKFEVTLPDVK